MDITLIEGCEKLAVQIVQVMAENVQHLSKVSQLVCQNFSLSKKDTKIFNIRCNLRSQY